LLKIGTVPARSVFVVGTDATIVHASTASGPESEFDLDTVADVVERI